MSHYTRSTGATRASNAEASRPVSYSQDVTVELFNGCQVSGPATYRGKGIARSQVLHRLNAAHDAGNLNDSFVIGGVLVSFASIKEVK
jgi:hypothetical protein